MAFESTASGARPTLANLTRTPIYVPRKGSDIRFNFPGAVATDGGVINDEDTIIGAFFTPPE
jgi:hypothetical protein